MVGRKCNQKIHFFLRVEEMGREILHASMIRGDDNGWIYTSGKFRQSGRFVMVIVISIITITIVVVVIIIIITIVVVVIFEIITS